MDSLLLSEDDVRQIVRLLGEVAGLRGSHLEKKRYLMGGLCRLVEGDAWAWSLLRLEQNLAPRQLLMLNGGFDEDRLAKWAIAIEHPQMEPVTGRLVAEAAAGTLGFTRKSQDFVPEDWWDSQDRAFELWTEAGIRSFMLSAWPLEDGKFSGIGIYRNKDRPPFTARECRIAHILLSEIPWLHGEGLGDDTGESMVMLQPRQRTVLNLLVQGWSRGKIADQLGLSINTVHSYVKLIFQHFGVHSQPELISRFTQGNGRDQEISENDPRNTSR